MAGKPNQVTRQIKGEIFNSLRNALVAPQGRSKKSWTDLFIKEMLNEAKTNPNGPLGQLLAKQLLQDGYYLAMLFHPAGDISQGWCEP